MCYRLLHICAFGISGVDWQSNYKCSLYLWNDTEFVYVEIHTSPTMTTATAFLRNLFKAVPYKISKILTDNGVQFTCELLLTHCRPEAKDGTLEIHPFDALCKELGIEHRLTQFRHPWTNGQVERMNRTLREATVKIYYYDTIQQRPKN